MALRCFFTGVILFLFLFMPGLTALCEEYKMGPGDTVAISIWKNQDLTRRVVVLPDDTIRFPLIGEIKVGGRSAAWLEKKLKSYLEKYISEPELSVSIEQTSSLAIYVIGQVKSPGRFGLNDNIDVLQGLSIAGGLTPFAKAKKIRIFRKENGSTKILHFNYDAVSEGRELDQNIMLQKGDVIVVR